MKAKPKVGEINKATKFTEHEKELIKEAYDHPIEQRHKVRMITEFRKGRWVKSIARRETLRGLSGGISRGQGGQPKQ